MHVMHTFICYQRRELVFSRVWVSSSVSGGPNTWGLALSRAGNLRVSPRVDLPPGPARQLIHAHGPTLADFTGRAKVGGRVRDVSLVGHVIVAAVSVVDESSLTARSRFHASSSPPHPRYAS